MDYAFDAAGRLGASTDGTNSASYVYLANSPQVGEISFEQNGTNRMSASKTYDLLGRLGSIAFSPTQSPVMGHGYAYNNANQRTRVALSDGSAWRYDYDDLGQVNKGARFWNDGSPVAGQRFEYGFDDIGNRTSSKAGGDENGANLRSASYAANNVNQITQRDVPGAVDVIGAGRGTVTVNSVSAYRKGEYYRKEIAVSNGSAAVWQAIDVESVDGLSSSNVTGNVFVAETPEDFGYDADGNLTSEGRWALGWDGENRLKSIVAHSGLPDGARKKVECDYDWQGRRIRKRSYSWVSGDWTLDADRKFLYDGWNLAAVLDGSNTLLQSFQWGSDLSGTMQGAGGVGGLISMTVHGGANAGVYFYAYDGNGNVAGLVNAANGQTVARYEYGLFGELIRATGVLARENPFRFSTKYQDDETGFLYYGYRYYDPSTGRWVNKDPITEKGGLNLFGFVYNCPTFWIDTDGKAPTSGTAGQSFPPLGDPTNEECSKFSWWNKVVGVTFSNCKPQLTKWGMQMPNFLQTCVMKHEEEHAKLCRNCGPGVTRWFWYGLFCSCPIKHCAEQAGYAESVVCAKEAMKTINQLSPDDQLALRCYLATSKQSCKANKKECDARYRKDPGGPSCD